MAKTRETRKRRVLTTTDEPKLLRLGLPRHLRNYRDLAGKLEDIKAQQGAELDLIGAILGTVQADGAIWTDGHGGKWRAARIADDPDATTTDAAKLRRNLSKIGKLDAKTIEKIYEASQVDRPRKGYVLVTLPKGGK